MYTYSTLKVDKIFIEDAMRENDLKYAFFQSQNLHFEYFPKIPSEINLTHPFTLL